MRYKLTVKKDREWDDWIARITDTTTNQLVTKYHGWNCKEDAMQTGQMMLEQLERDYPNGYQGN